MAKSTKNPIRQPNELPKHTIMSEFIAELIAKEDDSIASVIAFATYNPSIGRVLESGGVAKFGLIVSKLVKELSGIRSMGAFDRVHHNATKNIMDTFKTSRGGPLSYGHAQKPINVFLKVYVDWAHRPSAKIRKKLLCFLHVPLDKILMTTIASKFSEWYQKEIRPHVQIPQKAFSLATIDEEMYNRWQRFFRERYPRKPLIFDIAWALNR